MTVWLSDIQEMEDHPSLISPALVLAVIKKKECKQEKNVDKENEINPKLLLSCLDKAGQSSFFFQHSFCDNLEDIMEESEHDLEIEEGMHGEEASREFVVRNVIEGIIISVFTHSQWNKSNKYKWTEI